MSSIWDDVVGQRQAVENLNAATDRGPVHAYLFVGPAGSTKYEAARAFAARVLSGGDDADQRDARLARLCRETGAEAGRDDHPVDRPPHCGPCPSLRGEKRRWYSCRQ